jgi:hypothetical protein
MARWSVQQFVSSPRSVIRHRLQYLGIVVADTEKDAIATAAKLFRITRAQRKKIVVTKISESDD